jgi:hypothetical protein
MELALMNLQKLPLQDKAQFFIPWWHHMKAIT